MVSFDDETSGGVVVCFSAVTPIPAHVLAARSTAASLAGDGLVGDEELRGFLGGEVILER